MKTSQLAQLLRKVNLVIQDEVPIQYRHCFKAIYCLFVDIQNIVEDLLFRGIPFILSRDFAQILLVIKNSLQPNIVKACLQQSFIWPQLKQLHLEINIRVYNGLQDSQFIQWLSYLPYNLELNSQISLPLYILQIEDAIQLIYKIYPPKVL